MASASAAATLRHRRTSVDGSRRARARRTGTATARRSTGDGGQSSQAFDRDRGRPQRSHHGGASTSSAARQPVAERPRAPSAARAPGREHDVERPGEHGATLAAPTADIRGREPTGARARSGLATPRISIVRRRLGPHAPGRPSPCPRPLSWSNSGVEDRQRGTVGGEPDRDRFRGRVVYVTRDRVARALELVHVHLRAVLDAARSCSPVTVPRRTVARGHGTAKRFAGRTFSGSPSIATSHSRPYHPRRQLRHRELERHEEVQVRSHVERHRLELDRLRPPAPTPRARAPRRSGPDAGPRRRPAARTRPSRSRGTARSAPGWRPVRSVGHVDDLVTFPAARSGGTSPARL